MIAFFLSTYEQHLKINLIIFMGRKKNSVLYNILECISCCAYLGWTKIQELYHMVMEDLHPKIDDAKGILVGAL